jgi:hypothetical protein
MSSDTTVINHACHVLDGMHNDDATRCWMRLLRHGIAFRIEATAEDLEDTSFHQQWRALFGTEAPPRETSHEVIERWDQLCNLLIETSLPVLQDLAPEEITCDRSLRACFHTPTYHLQIARDPLSGAVHASVASGPVDGSPSGCQVAKVGDLDAFAPGLTHYSSGDVEVIDSEAGLSMPPRKVRTPDGAVHGFKACVQDSKRLDTDHVSNRSRDVIRVYLQLHKDPLGETGMPSVSGIVVDEGALAGILLQDIAGAKNLASRLQATATVQELERVRRLAPGWLARISSIVAQLHRRGFCLNDEGSGIEIHESQLVVDDDDRVWLPLASIFQMDEEVEERLRLTSKDEEVVRQVFERFVPEQLKKREAQTASTVTDQ